MPRYTEVIMLKKSESAETRSPDSIELKPPVSAQDLVADTELDPAGAEEFVALIRALRKETPRPLSI